MAMEELYRNRWSAWLMRSLCTFPVKRLERRGQNIVLLSASLAAVHDRRLAESRARIDALLKTRQANTDNRQTNTEESPAASEPLLIQIPAARTDNVSASSAPSQKPASWWRQFIFEGALIPSYSVEAGSLQNL
jgi:hypothetical protein